MRTCSVFGRLGPENLGSGERKSYLYDETPMYTGCAPRAYRGGHAKKNSGAPGRCHSSFAETLILTLALAIDKRGQSPPWLSR